jgi:LPXTG-motif cell wall-anchored protein
VIFTPVATPQREVAVRSSRVRASLAAAAAISAATLAFAAPASAYPPGNTSNVRLSDTSVVPGQSVTASDSGNEPGEQVNGYAHSVRVFLGSTTANGNGVATLTFTVPRSLSAGAHTVRLVGQSSGHVGTATFFVTKGGAVAPAAGGSGLPFTGGNEIWPMTAAGTALVLVGGVAVFVARRRRAHSGLAA